MNALLQVLKNLVPSIVSQRERDETYMAAAVDIQDFERRLRQVDERGRESWSPIANGLYTR